MKGRLYVIYDRVAMESNVPFLAKNDNQAVRMYEKALVDAPDAQDFILCDICSFDTETMAVEPTSPSRQVNILSGGGA